MDQHAGITISTWMPRSLLRTPEALSTNANADVCIVGAGISGLTTAYLLAKEGRSVVVLDDGPICGGETERTTAHLSNALDDRYTWLESRHGAEGAKLAAQSHSEAIARIETIVREENIDCDFRRLDGYLFVPPGVSSRELEDELAAAHRAGLTAVELVPHAPYPMYETSPILRFPNQGQFHPLKYLSAVANRIVALGGRIYCNTRVLTVTGGNSATVETENGLKISCASAVVATNSPCNDRVVIHTKQAPYRTYAVALVVPTGAVPPALYWDTAQDAEESKSGHSASYHYVRLQPAEGGKHELLIVGGEDHKTGQAEDMEARWNKLEKWTRERFPMADGLEYRWSGQVMEPVDGMAFIGRNPGEDNVYIATGDSGHGMTHGTIAGMLIRDLAMGRTNPWASLYDPSRKFSVPIAEFAKENLNVVAKYTELLTGGDIGAIGELPPDSGGVLRKGATKVAVYRDAQGVVHQFSAICPHLGCVVHWNPGEKSWDCPCHGSRFTKLGEVINGPSPVNLKPLSAPVEGE